MDFLRSKKKVEKDTFNTSFSLKRTGLGPKLTPGFILGQKYSSRSVRKYLGDGYLLFVNWGLQFFGQLSKAAPIGKFKIF